ncbi:MAG: hypothetical protein ACE5IY_19895 [bacterium]
MIIINIVAIAALGFLAELLMPWWSVALAAFLVGGWRGKGGWQTWIDGFAGIALLWLGSATWIHWQSGGILTRRVGEMLHLPAPFLVLILTAVLGGVVGGLAAVSGYHLKMLLRKGQS